MNNKILCFSGAADKIAFHYGVAYRLNEQSELDKFDAYAGTSSGAIIALMIMCGDFDESLDTILRFTPKKDIFGYNPFGVIGIAIAAYNIVRGETDGLWSMNRLEKTLRDNTNKNKFDNYKGGSVWVGITNPQGQIYYVNLKGMSYHSAIQNVIKSCSIPVVVDSINGYTDGGIVDHIATPYLSTVYPECDFISVFAREDKPFNRKKPKRVISSLLWLIDRLVHDISINDEKLSDYRTKSHKKIFMPNNPVKGMFRLKEEDNQTLFKMGYDKAI